MLRRTTVVGQQAMRAFKSKIQATKPKDTTKMVCDGVVVSARGSLLRVPPRTPFPPARLLRPISDSSGRTERIFLSASAGEAPGVRAASCTPACIASMPDA